MNRVVLGALVLAASLLADPSTPGAVADPGPGIPGHTVYSAGVLSGGVSAVRVEADGGTALVQGSPFGSQTGGFSVTISPDGRHVFAGSALTGTISVFDVQPDGALSSAAVPTVTTGMPVAGLAVAADGRTLYATGGAVALSLGGVRAYAIGPGGALAARGPAIAVGGLLDPVGLPAVSRDGRHLYVARYLGNKVIHFPLAADGRVLPAVGSVRAGGLPVSPALSPDGRLLYVVNEESNTTSGYRVGTDGALTPVPGSPFSTGQLPHSVSFTPDGRYVHIPNLLGNSISGFRVGPGGGLTELPGSPYPVGPALGRPSKGVVSPDGRFLYVVEIGSLADGALLNAHLRTMRIGGDGSLSPVAGSEVETSTRFADGPSLVVTPDQGPRSAFQVLSRKGRTVTFDARASEDPDGRVARYEWRFGDGTGAVTTVPQVSHRFGSGTYAVALRVVDGEGCSTEVVHTGQSSLCRPRGARTERRVRVR